MLTNLAANQIEIAKEKLIEAFNPLSIYLFGSFAWGTPHENSDMDFLIVIDDYNKTRQKTLAAAHLALACLDLPKDILLYSKEEKYGHKRSTLCYKIKHNGIQIYVRDAFEK